MKIRRIDVVSLGKIFGVIYAGLGLLAGLFMALGVLAWGLFPAIQQGPPAAPAPGGLLAVVLAVAVLVVAPFIYGLIGFVGGIVTAALYNLAAGITGGLEIET